MMTGAWTRPCRSRTLMIVRCERWILQLLFWLACAFFLFFLHLSLTSGGRVWPKRHVGRWDDCHSTKDSPVDTRLEPKEMTFCFVWNRRGRARQGRRSFLMV